MQRTDHSLALAWMCVRLVLALVLVFAIVGLFQAAIPPGATNKPWIAPNAPSIIPVWIYAVAFALVAILFVAGWQVPVAAIALSTMLIAISVERLVHNPFTNLTADVALIMALSLALLAAGPEKDRWSVDRVRRATALPPAVVWSWIALFVRLFVGAIFFAQGFRNLFLGAGPITFAERLYVKPFAGTMPEPLLWIAGVVNPFLQFGVGLLLIVGLFTRSAAAVGTLFLVSIIFGHLMQGPLTAPGAMRDFATANFIAMIMVIIAASHGNRWSLDAVLFDGREKSPK